MHASKLRSSTPDFYGDRRVRFLLHALGSWIWIDSLSVSGYAYAYNYEYEYDYRYAYFGMRL